MSDKRLILLGMVNPLSMKPRHALFPSPVGCTGWRIWQALRDRDAEFWTEDRYLELLDRRNLVAGQWLDVEARRAARKLVEELRDSGRVVILLGERVRDAFRTEEKSKRCALDKSLLHPVVWHGVTWRQMPHPSGMNRFYNGVVGRRLLGAAIDELARRYAGE
jgi:hypothetical protein